MALTKADIVDSLHEREGVSKKEASELVELVFETMKQTLAQGEKIKISGFGNFVIRDKRARMGRNPQTGQSIEISARRVLTFRPSQVLRAEVNAALGGKPVTEDQLRKLRSKEDSSNDSDDDGGDNDD